MYNQKYMLIAIMENENKRFTNISILGTTTARTMVSWVLKIIIFIEMVKKQVCLGCTSKQNALRFRECLKNRTHVLNVQNWPGSWYQITVYCNHDLWKKIKILRKLFFSLKKLFLFVFHYSVLHDVASTYYFKFRQMKLWKDNHVVQDQTGN